MGRKQFVVGRLQPISMHRRPPVVVFAARVKMKPAFQTVETAAIKVIFKPIHWIAPAQVKITEYHAAEVSQVRDPALTGGHRRVQRNGADDPDEVLHLDREEKVKIDDS